MTYATSHSRIQLVARLRREAGATTAGIADLGAALRDRRPISVSLACLASIAAIAAGNSIVLASRAAGGAWGELVTFAAVLLLGGGSVAVLRVGAYPWGSLGFARPRRLSLPARGLPLMAGALVVLSIGVAGVRSLHTHDWEVAAPILLLVRVIIGTALGEELIHRGALLSLWAATGRSPLTALCANAGTFGLWHTAAALEHGFFWPFHILGPALFALLCCWGRIRTGSILTPVLLHAAVNSPGTALS